MIVKTLVENTSISDQLGSEHGLSLYIETKNRKILFDLGASDLFYKNAKQLGVDLTDVDCVVISHAHNDHGGGLTKFLKINTKADVLVRNIAFQPYYAKRANGTLEEIGLDKSLAENRQIVLTPERYFIDKDMQLFSNISTPYPLPISNEGLSAEEDGQVVPDPFRHEQILVLEEGGKTLLLTGCAHNGILNIVRHYYQLSGKFPDVVIGGFHLSSRSHGNETDETIRSIGSDLLETGAKYYTCHCTGIGPYHLLKETMGDRIEYLAGGRTLTI